MKKKLLILNTKQFGYHIDTYYYCKYLKDNFEITYLCWDYGYKRTDVDGVKVKYIERKGGKITRYLRFQCAAMMEIVNGYDICFIKYYFGCALFRMLFPSQITVFDVRTGHTWDNQLKRVLMDMALKLESLCFNNITVISEGLVSKFHFPKHKVHILPLGADVISVRDKSFEDIRLLYVGTLKCRNIHDTVNGFEMFYSDFGDSVTMSYTIVGCGVNGEDQELARLIAEKDLEDVVKLEGFVPHDELVPYFESQNIGVSYIPITPYFDCQPPTKTYEYILSGMPVIATKTTENAKVVCDGNGVLVSDTKNGFYEGMKAIYENRLEFRSTEIRSTCLEHTWQSIVKYNLKIYLDGLISSAGERQIKRVLN